MTRRDGVRHRILPTCGLCICLPIVLFSVAGCGLDSPGPPTIRTWQQNVERYVWEHGNGDPNVLADTSWDDVHRGLAVIGDPIPDRSTDQIGLLVAHRILDGKPYFVFLLGSITRGILTDLRPVALQVEAGEFNWTIGSPNPDALALYRAWSEADRKRGNRSDPQPPPFPRPRDDFAVTVIDDRIDIRHSESGAEWDVQPVPVIHKRGASRPIDGGAGQRDLQ